MKRLLLTTAMILLASPAFAKEYTIKEVSDPAGSKPFYFSPSRLTIQPGDKVNFVNAQDDMHDVMFVSVPKGVEEMIMSPMHEKKGDTFSYTFTVPGTYQFHCHPHEELGMKGTLIVGSPSKPEDIVSMDHHKMSEKAEGKSTDDHQEAGTNLAEATGTLNSVDLSGKSINVTHNPIKALGWPKMKMQFAVEKDVDLSKVKAGDTVNFTLKPKGESDYVVTKITKQ